MNGVSEDLLSGSAFSCKQDRTVRGRQSSCHFPCTNELLARSDHIIEGISCLVYVPGLHFIPLQSRLELRDPVLEGDEGLEVMKDHLSHSSDHSSTCLYGITVYDHMASLYGDRIAHHRPPCAHHLRQAAHRDHIEYVPTQGFFRCYAVEWFVGLAEMADDPPVVDDDRSLVRVVQNGLKQFGWNIEIAVGLHDSTIL